MKALSILVKSSADDILKCFFYFVLENTVWRFMQTAPLKDILNGMNYQEIQIGIILRAMNVHTKV